MENLKRFQLVNKYNPNELLVDYECLCDGVEQLYDAEMVVDELNRLDEENKIMKRELSEYYNGDSYTIFNLERDIERLENENEELLSKKNNQLQALYDIINTKLEDYEADLEKSVKAGMPTSIIYHGMELLESLKKELHQYE